MTSSKRFAFRFESPLLKKQIERIAKANKRSTNAEINLACEEHVKGKK